MEDATLYLELGTTAENGTVTPLLAITDAQLIAEVGQLIAKRLGAVDARVLQLVRPAPDAG